MTRSTTLRSVDDLLTPQQKAELHADLAEVAAARRRGEDAAAQFVFGQTNGRRNQ